MGKGDEEMKITDISLGEKDLHEGNIVIEDGVGYLIVRDLDSMEYRVVNLKNGVVLCSGYDSIDELYEELFSPQDYPTKNCKIKEIIVEKL